MPRDLDAPTFTVGPGCADLEEAVQECNRALRDAGYNLYGPGISAVVITGLYYLAAAEVPREQVKKMCCEWIDAMIPPSC